MTEPAILALADGTIFEGISIGASGYCVGELVFNTAMTGYQEMLTDPSYANQIITLTAPHIGNTGCNPEDMESTRIWAQGLVIRNYTHVPSNYRSTQSLSAWLKKNRVVAISGVDTRYLTQWLRDNGSTGACISTEKDPKTAIQKAQAFKGLNDADLAKTVSRQTIERWDAGRDEWGQGASPLHYHVVVFDFGVKLSILKILHDMGCHVTLVPAETSAEKVFSLNPNGIVLSNGPGDPKACRYAIEATKRLLEKNIPILGICLGFQILALACGAKTKKMKFGHHGANHPVVCENENHRVFITSQNHGFMVDEKSLPSCLEVTHRSLFDKSLQGIRHRDKLAVGFQGHPEASPGPHDIESIFKQFIQLMDTL